MYANKSQVTKLVKSVIGIDDKLSLTFRDWAIDVSKTFQSVYGGWSLDETICEEFPGELDKLLAAITEKAVWKNRKDKRQRTWEVRTILKGYYGLDDAAKKWGGPLNKKIIIALAQELPTNEVDAAIKKAKKKIAKKAAPPSAESKIKSALKAIKSAATKKRNVVAFRKELKELCDKHGIDY